MLLTAGAAGRRSSLGSPVTAIYTPGDAKLSDAVKAECARLRKHYKHSSFVVLSSLAEGADRLVARVAMEELSAELIAVLPMPQNEYERDFQTEELKAEFRSFLSALAL